MRRPLSIIAVLALIISLFAVTAHARDRRIAPAKGQSASTAGEPKLALVIGNAAYKSSPLANPVNDARSMATALRSLGFDVILIENAGLDKMREAVEKFGDRLTGGGVGMFYYSGHGMQVKGENYLVPVDAQIKGEAEVSYKALNAGIILAKMELAHNHMNIVILDACRDNPFSRSFRSAATGLASMNAPSGTILAYSTAPGSVASDGDGRNGLYTGELVREMSKPGVRIEDVFMKVRRSVKAKSGGEQVPWESYSIDDVFYFVEPQPGGKQSAPEPEVAYIPPDKPAQTYSKAVTTNSGLIYEDLKVGDGAAARSGQKATVNYTGWLTDGTKFDSSLDRNTPFTFNLGAGQVIGGWDEGVQGMKIGGKRKLTIPPNLAYGARGAGSVIPPNSTLVFEVELISVE